MLNIYINHGLCDPISVKSNWQLYYWAINITELKMLERVISGFIASGQFHTRSYILCTPLKYLIVNSAFTDTLRNMSKNI